MAVRLGAVLVLVAAIAPGCGGSGKPRFQPAAGWHLLARQGELAAANVDFAARDRSLASPPSHTVASLPRPGVLLWLLVNRRSHGLDGKFPAVPLRVSETVATNPPEGFFCPPAARSDCFSAGGAIRRLQARDSGWDIAVTIFFGTDHPLPEQVAAADAELARLQLPHARTTPAPQAASCRRPTGTDYYDTTVSPSSGPAGTTVTVSGRLPTLSESGREIGQTATEVVAYWNLDLDHWPSITTAHPVAAVARSPVKFLGTENVAGRCTYRARLTIPQAPPGTYPVEVLYGDPHGGASFAPADFQVTKS